MSAAGLFESRGYTATTTREIATAVGLRQASLFHYFARKERLATGAEQDILNVALNTVRAGVDIDFGGLSALDRVSLEVPPGRIVGLIGPNGAGKTTMFNVLTGLQGASTGRVLFGGADVSRWPAHRRGRAGMARAAAYHQ